jgi:ABC-type uncharacterized transport system substrate-binding protein
MRINHLRRRQFITVLGGAAVAWPIVAGAQQPERMRRIDVLMAYAESDPEGQALVAAFREGLLKLGWTESRNVRIETRWATADLELMQRFATEIVALQPDLILTQNTPTTAAMLQQTRSIPIIFATGSDPVGSGFVASFARPGGNITGFYTVEPARSQRTSTRSCSRRWSSPRLKKCRRFTSSCMIERENRSPSSRSIT